jgi:hypothetical protein
MQRDPHPALFRFVDPPRVALVLHGLDGAEWAVTMSAGTERFIGHYSRLGGIDAEGPLLDYRATAESSPSQGGGCASLLEGTLPSKGPKAEPWVEVRPDPVRQCRPEDSKAGGRRAPRSARADIDSAGRQDIAHLVIGSLCAVGRNIWVKVVHEMVLRAHRQDVA